MRRMTDGERELLAELEADARASAEDLEDLWDYYDDPLDVIGELMDAARYVRECESDGETEPMDPDNPW